MNYPNWVPECLVNLHKLRLEHTLKGKRTSSSNPDDEIAKIRKDERFKSWTESQFIEQREALYRQRIGLPVQESDALLLKLISDLRMKDVWLSLARREKTGYDATRFWMVCEGAIVGWRGKPKITQKERLKILTNIQESLASLQSNMHNTRAHGSE